MAPLIFNLLTRDRKMSGLLSKGYSPWYSLNIRCTLEDPGIDGRIILRWIFRKWDVGAWTGLIWLRIGTGSRLL
jgi:hypothetical protein